MVLGGKEGSDGRSQGGGGGIMSGLSGRRGTYEWSQGGGGGLMSGPKGASICMYLCRSTSLFKKPAPP